MSYENPSFSGVYRCEPTNVSNTTKEEEVVIKTLTADGTVGKVSWIDLFQGLSVPADFLPA